MKLENYSFEEIFKIATSKKLFTEALLTTFIFSLPVMFLLIFFLRHSTEPINVLESELEGVNHIRQILGSWDPNSQLSKETFNKIESIALNSHIILDPRIHTYQWAMLTSKAFPSIAAGIHSDYHKSQAQENFTILKSKCSTNCNLLLQFSERMKRPAYVDNLKNLKALWLESLQQFQNELRSEHSHRINNRMLVYVITIAFFCLGLFISMYMLLAKTLLHQNLKKASAFLEQVCNGAQIGYWEWKIDTNTIEFSEGWYDTLGMPFSDHQANLIEKLSRIHPDDSRQYFEEIIDYIDGHSNTFENVHRVKHSDGKWIWVLDKGRVVERTEEGKPLKFIGTQLDITSLKEAQSLTEEVQKLAKIGGWEINTYTRHLNWSTPAISLLKLEEDATEGIDFDSVNCFSDEDKLKIKGLVDQCILGVGFRESLTLINRPNQMIVEMRGEPILGPNGDVRMVRGTFQDISEKVKAEIELETSRLKGLHSAKLASIGEMSTCIVHEINNPLAIIKAAATGLNRFKNDEIKFNSTTDSIFKSVERMSKIINGLKRFTHFSGNSVHEPHSVDAIIQESSFILDAKFKSRSTTSSYELNSRSMIDCDNFEIEQVIINLVGNAIDAVKSLPDKWVTIKTFDENDEVVLQIIDSGPTISEELESKIFESFFTTKPIGEGTGLGLSISTGIIKSHKGTMKINRTYATTCFEVRFRKSAASVMAA